MVGSESARTSVSASKICSRSSRANGHTNKQAIAARLAADYPEALPPAWHRRHFYLAATHPGFVARAREAPLRTPEGGDSERSEPPWVLGRIAACPSRSARRARKQRTRFRASSDQRRGSHAGPPASLVKHGLERLFSSLDQCRRKPRRCVFQEESGAMMYLRSDTLISTAEQRFHGPPADHLICKCRSDRRQRDIAFVSRDLRYCGYAEQKGDVALRQRRSPPATPQIVRVLPFHD